MRPTAPTSPGSPQARPVLGYSLFPGNRDQLIDLILHAARSIRAPWRLGYLNAAQFNLGASDPDFARRLRAMDLLYPDGQSIVWAARRRGVRLDARLTAADFIGDFFRRAATAGVSVALVGGPPGAAAAFASYWSGQVPGLEIRFTCDGFFAPGRQADVCRNIEAANPDIVLVGMGAPRQECFVERASASGAPRVWWCVGALFEYGPWGRRRAPRWMRDAGMEWAFRLAQEPRRLAGRYLIGNPLFVWRVLAGRHG